MGTKLEILQKLYRGKTRKDIANELYLSPCTVATYQDVIYKEQGVNSQKELMGKYIKYLEGVINGTDRNGLNKDGTEEYPISNEQLNTWNLRCEGITERDIPF